MTRSERRLLYFFAAIMITLASMSHLLEGYLDFGAPGTGFHATRFLGLALYDTLAVLGVSIIIGLVRGWKIYMVFVVLILISVPIHLIFGQKTALVAPIYR